MKRLFSIAILVSTSVSFLGAASFTAPYKVRGMVVRQGSDQPVEKAYIIAVSGEEEVLTARDGSFTLATWQKLPAVIMVQHPDFRTEKIVVTDSTQRVLIRLQVK